MSCERILLLVAIGCVLVAAGIGAKIGVDLHDAMACGCSVGWVTVQ